MGAWGMADSYVPGVVQQIPHVALIVLTRRLSRQEVAGHRIMPEGGESITDSAGILARHQHPQPGTG